MKISEFRAGLVDLQDALRKWGAVRQAGELDNLSAALSEFDDLTMADLVKRIKAINAPTKAPKKAKQLDIVAVERYLAMLKAAAHSSDAFDRALEQIVEDKKQLPPAELKELARLFGGSIPAKSSRPAIAEFLRARRLEMRRGEGLGATIDRMLGRS